MDIHTLAVITCLSAAFMTVGMAALQWAAPTERSLRDWALAGLLFLGNSLMTFVFRSIQPGDFVALAVGVANACTVAGHLCVLSGLRRHLGLSPIRGWALGVGLAVVAAHATPWVRASVEARLLVMLPVLMAVCLVTAAQILRAPGYRPRSVLSVLLVVELLYALQLAVRTGLILQSGASTGARELLGSDLIQTFGRLSMFLYIALASASCGLLVIRKLALDLQRHAQTDPMTGWLNRRTMGTMLAAEFERARRGGSGLQLITFDIDHFKRINDVHGHAVGDQAIRHVTTLAGQELRGYDHKFRIGGEEFLVCIPGGAAAPGAEVAERLRRRIEVSPLDLALGGQPLSMTVSIGCASQDVESPSWEAVLQQADEALYRAKQGGRNRVEIHGAGSLVAAG